MAHDVVATLNQRQCRFIVMVFLIVVIHIHNINNLSLLRISAIYLLNENKSYVFFYIWYDYNHGDCSLQMSITIVIEAACFWK